MRNCCMWSIQKHFEIWFATNIKTWSFQPSKTQRNEHPICIKLASAFEWLSADAFKHRSSCSPFIRVKTNQVLFSIWRWLCGADGWILSSLVYYLKRKDFGFNPWVHFFQENLYQPMGWHFLCYSFDWKNAFDLLDSKRYCKWKSSCQSCYVK